MPWTAVTCWIGSLALIGTPFFSGFYSKDLIIDAVHEQHLHHPDNGIVTYAYWCVMIGVFVTAFYSFRLLFMTFHGKPRWAAAAAHGHGHDDHVAHDAHAETHPVVHAGHDDHETHDEPGDHHGGTPHETPWVVRGPLVALAIPSVLIGALTVTSLIFGNGFGNAIFIDEAHNVLHVLHEEFGDPVHFALFAFAHPVLYLVLGGVLAAWALYIKWPDLPGRIDAKLRPLRVILENKYWFDWINENIIARGSRLLGTGFWKIGDGALIDGAIIGGSTGFIGWFAGVIRRVQSGFLYSYAFWMVIGLAVMIGWFLSRVH
jgi:NADH-quinone oxidoreductase subunit L